MVGGFGRTGRRPHVLLGVAAAAGVLSYRRNGLPFAAGGPITHNAAAKQNESFRP
jgi:hypothetical protein